MNEISKEPATHLNGKLSCSWLIMLVTMATLISSHVKDKNSIFTARDEDMIYSRGVKGLSPLGNLKYGVVLRLYALLHRRPFLNVFLFCFFCFCCCCCFFLVITYILIQYLDIHGPLGRGGGTHPLHLSLYRSVRESSAVSKIFRKAQFV